MLKIANLHASIGKTLIIKGVNLTVGSGEIHAIMGPNGSGKSTLAATLMGNPAITVTRGSVELDGMNLLALTAALRAQQGIFLGFQHPVEIPGVSANQMLRIASNAANTAQGRSKLAVAEFRKLLDAASALLQLPNGFLARSINDGCSGGERKKMEMLQCLALEPRFAILDETDSGLDVDALRTIARGIRTLVERFNTGVLLITHYQRILHHINPDRVHVFVDGRIVESGSKKLAEIIEKEGYGQYNS